MESLQKKKREKLKSSLQDMARRLARIYDMSKDEEYLQMSKALWYVSMQVGYDYNDIVISSILKEV